MLHIILGILKIIGIILLWIVAIVLILLLLALFYPIGYKIKADKSEDSYCAQGTIHWLFYIINLSFFLKDGDQKMEVRIFGIPIDLSGKKKEKKRKKKKKKEKALTYPKTDEDHKKNINVHNKEEEIFEHKEKTYEGQEKTHEDESTPLDDEENCNMLGEYVHKIKSFVIKLKKFFMNLRQTIKRICDKIKEIKDQGMNLKAFLQSDRFQQGFDLCKKEFMALLRHIKPRKYRGYVHFGLEDPASTGQALGVISIFYPIFKDHVKIVPDFEQEVWLGNFYARGRMQTFFILKILWTLYKDKNIQYMIKKMSK